MSARKAAGTRKRLLNRTRKQHRENSVTLTRTERKNCHPCAQSKVLPLCPVEKPEPGHLALLLDLLRMHLPPDARAWAFGSRTTGAALRYSDLDIALEAPEAL